ncbi:hypothetical protein ACPOL_1270 [Acidisarcina polymorpha]|uniref:Uncharacterized protein n=1 Tax=Acidisarcina polymorpha TaxID=2211140 RepID=A0A2Z5FUR9_9BACT|nr:hypothetical protein [Acidisarcina polymorpha]AXC10618.1 hypothetical protein ACPOL_1270 [Acidisarcina polymorpha]
MSERVTTPAAADPDSIEVAAGFEHENLEGWIPELASDSEIVAALDKAFDYRGDITITGKDGTKFDGYIFDRRPGKSLSESFVRLFPVNSNEKLSISYADIARLEFGKDRAAGKHWEHWVAQYQQKKAAGEKNIGLQPEALD